MKNFTQFSGNSRPSTSSTQRCSSRDVEETENFSNNVANAGMSSRARMLAQQRELQLKRRQNAMQNGGDCYVLKIFDVLKTL
jgi:hypothetical protein